jgi:hypothetical protein
MEDAELRGGFLIRAYEILLSPSFNGFSVSRLSRCYLRPGRAMEDAELRGGFLIRAYEI